MNSSDGVLLGRWQNSRDPEAFRTLVERHSDMVYGTCRRVLRNTADAEEVAQECFLNLSLARDDTFRSLGGWLHTLATHRSLDRLKSDERRHAREQRYIDLTDAAETEAWNDIQEWIDEAIEGLPAKFRGPLVSHYLERESHAQIAERAGIPRSTVSRYIARGVDEVRKSLKRRGVVATSTLLAGLFESIPAEAAPVALSHALGKMAVSGGNVRGASVASGKGGVFASTGAKVGFAMLTFAVVVAGAWLFANTPSAERKSTNVLSEVQDSVATPSDTDDEATARSSISDGKDLNEETSELDRESVGLNANAAKTDPTALPVDATIFGRVVDLQGAPVVGVGVRYRRPVSLSFIPFDFYSNPTTDENGAFRIERIPPLDELHLEARANEAGQKSAPVIVSDVRAGGEYEVELVMHEASISGRVVDAAGRPVPHAEVLAQPPNPYVFGLPVDHANEQGVFEIRGLFAGEYELKAKTEGPKSWSSTGLTLSVSPTQAITGMRLVLPDQTGAYISGEIVAPEGQPVAGARVQAIMGGPPWTSNWSISEEDGTFAVNDLDEGYYNLQVQHPDRNFKMARNVEAYTENTRIVLGLRGSIKGQVVDQLTGLPVTRFEIHRYVPISDDSWWMVNSRFLEVNDSDGRFTLDRIQAGEPTVTIRASGYAQREQQVHLDEGEALTGVVVALSPAASLIGRVLDESHEPIVGALVYAGPLPYQMNRTAADGVRSGVDGIFEIAYDSETTTMLTARHHGYATGWVDLSTDMNEVEIVLADGGRIEGVVSVDGVPTSEANMGILYPDARHRTAAIQTSSSSDPDGTITVPRVVPGSVIVFTTLRLDRPYGSRMKYVLLNIESETVYPVDIDYRMGDGILTGRAVHGGVPMADVEISLSDRRWTGVGSLGDVAAISSGEAMEVIEFRTDQQGRFNLEGLTPGEWTINAHSGGESYSMDVHIEAGAVTEQDFEIAD
jgi:RNA polymerase sigma factor (sigma-70 family)